MKGQHNVAAQEAARIEEHIGHDRKESFETCTSPLKKDAGVGIMEGFKRLESR